MSVQEKINRMFADRRIVIIPDDVERPSHLEYIFIKDLSLEDRNYYLLVKDLEAARANKDGVPSEKEVMECARQQGYWGKEEEDIINNADKYIAFLEEEFEAKKKFKSRQNIISVQINDAKAKKEWANKKLSEFRLASAEYLAHEIASFKLLRRVVFSDENKLLLEDDETFLYFKSHYIGLLYFLIREITSEGLMPVSDIREIAKSPDWRLLWSLCRNDLSSLFNRKICDLTLNHKVLIYWSRVYDSAIEGVNPPEAEVIQDDDLFDEWLNNRDMDQKESKSSKSLYQEQGQILDGEYVEECNCGAKQKNKNKYLGEKIMHENTCPYGTWHKYTPQEKEQRARQIYNRNAKSIRKLIDNEQEHVAKRGFIDEGSLRNKKSRELLGMKTKITTSKK